MPVAGCLSIVTLSGLLVNDLLCVLKGHVPWTSPFFLCLTLVIDVKMLSIGFNFAIEGRSDVCEVSLLLVELRMINLAIDSLSCSLSEPILGTLGTLCQCLHLRLLLVIDWDLRLLFSLLKLRLLRWGEYDFARERCQVVLGCDVLKNGTEMIHVSRVGPLSDKHEVVFGGSGTRLAWLRIRNEFHLLEADHLEQKSCLVNISNILPDAGVRQTKLAKLVFVRVFEDVLNDSVHDFDSLAEQHVRSQLNAHIQESLPVESI